MFAATRTSRRLRDLSLIYVQRVFVTCAIVAGALAGPSALPAHAATGDLTCTIDFQINFSPALTATNTSAKVSLTAGLVGCMSPNGVFPDLRSATAIGSGSAASGSGGNPCSLLLNIQLKASTTWSPTGQHSKASFTINTNAPAGTVTLRGVVTSGVLAGDSFTPVAIVITPNPDCAVKGLISLIGENQVIFN
jgi:hypothetical protein